MLGDIDGALADHGRALELQPGYLPALTGRSQLLNDRNDHAAALADAERGLRKRRTTSRCSARRPRAARSRPERRRSRSPRPRDYPRASAADAAFPARFNQGGGRRRQRRHRYFHARDRHQSRTARRLLQRGRLLLNVRKDPPRPLWTSTKLSRRTGLRYGLVAAGAAEAEPWRRPRAPSRMRGRRCRSMRATLLPRSLSPACSMDAGIWFGAAARHRGRGVAAGSGGDPHRTDRSHDASRPTSDALDSAI